jgi:hypothetical protein
MRDSPPVAGIASARLGDTAQSASKRVLGRASEHGQDSEIGQRGSLSIAALDHGHACEARNYGPTTSSSEPAVSTRSVQRSSSSGAAA